MIDLKVDYSKQLATRVLDGCTQLLGGIGK
jgi:hypothetical protein